MLQWQERQTKLNLIPQESKIGWHRTVPLLFIILM